MSFWERWRPLFVFGPIMGLIVLGLFLSVRSGVVSLSRGKDLRLLVANLTSVALRVTGYIAGLMVVQRIIGFPLELGL